MKPKKVNYEIVSDKLKEPWNLLDEVRNLYHEVCGTDSGEGATAALESAERRTRSHGELNKIPPYKVE